MIPEHRRVQMFVGQCLRKKKLSYDMSRNVIKRAAKEGTTLYSYYCPHCTHYHITKRKPDGQP
jgi:hypothetical protein